ncbi:formylglycine-generating enzyme family protein, partial [Streptococcus pyogenes]
AETHPVHEICFEEPFWIDQTEVTQGDFERIYKDLRIQSQFEGLNRPIESITWNEAREFCELGRKGRLPSETEWEYAARGPKG